MTKLQRMVTFIKVTSIALLLLFMVRFIGALPYKISFNFTNSMPVGMYIIQMDINHNKLQHGDLVAVCVPDKLFSQLAISRKYLSRGACHYGTAFELKELSGLPGDFYLAESTSLIEINHRVIPNTMQLLEDSTGARMYSKLNPTGKLIESEYLVFGHTYNSFDSRYYGIVPKQFIIGKAYPLITW